MLTPPIITVGRTIRRMPAKKRVSYVNDDLRLFENGATISAQLPKVSPGTLCAGGGNADVLLLHLATYPALARKHCLDRRRREDQHCPIRGMPHPLRKAANASKASTAAISRHMRLAPRRRLATGAMTPFTRNVIQAESRIKAYGRSACRRLEHECARSESMWS
jgi:hypothetical protein